MTSDTTSFAIQPPGWAELTGDELDRFLAFVPQGIAAADTVRIRRVSGYGLRQLGCPEQDLQDLRIDEHAARWHLLHTDRRAPKVGEAPLCRAVVGGETVIDEEWLVERAEGTFITIVCSAAPLLSDDGTITGGILTWRDISTGKREQENYRRLYETAAESQAAIDEVNKELHRFTSSVSHDLQEPLRSISGFTDILVRRHGHRLDSDAMECINFIQAGCERMGHMISGLLTYSRTIHNKPLQDRVDLNRVLAGVLENLTGAIGESNARVTSDALPIVRGDFSRLAQLLQNLIGNAIKYRAQDRSPEIQVSAAPYDAMWLITVSDNGIGIEAEHYKRIFQPFARLHTRREYAGTGLGLAICERIVEQHGGKLWVESMPGHGSRFFFTLRPDA